MPLLANATVSTPEPTVLWTLVLILAHHVYKVLAQLNHPGTVSIVTVMPATSALPVQDKNVRDTEA